GKRCHQPDFNRLGGPCGVADEVPQGDSSGKNKSLAARQIGRHLKNSTSEGSCAGLAASKRECLPPTPIASKPYATTVDNDDGTVDLISKPGSREDASIAQQQ